MVKIIADSTCDLSDATLKKYDIDMLPLYIHMGENEYKMQQALQSLIKGKTVIIIAHTIGLESAEKAIC